MSRILCDDLRLPHPGLPTLVYKHRQHFTSVCVQFLWYHMGIGNHVSAVGHDESGSLEVGAGTTGWVVGTHCNYTLLDPFDGIY